jgi:hypothetical protein
MNCHEFRGASIEFARSGVPLAPDAEDHVRGCTVCARFLESQLALSSALAAIAREDAAVPAPPELEAQVLAACLPPKRLRLMPILALAASLIAGAVLLRSPAPPPQAAAQPFIQIPYTVPLAPYERAEVVRMEVPVTALIAAGFHVRAVDTGAVLDAEAIVGQDRRVHAIRLISQPERIILE